MTDSLPLDGRRVLIDGYNLALAEGTGIATYARELGRAVRALGGETHILYGLSTGGSGAGATGVRRPRFAKLRSLARRTRLLAGSYASGDAAPLDSSEWLATAIATATAWNSAQLYDRANVRFGAFRSFSQARLPMRTDIAHWTCPLPVHMQGALNVYTIHDLVPLILPGASKGADKFRRLTQKIVDRADHILTVSERSRRDIIDILGARPERVSNTYQAVDGLGEADTIKFGAETAAPLARRGLERGDYFLFFGAIEPKKNLLRLLEAYQASGVRAPLVVAGKLGWSYEGEMAKLTELGCQNITTEQPRPSPGPPVYRIDYLEREDLLSLIANSKAVLFPSLYEGFGLPVLEAMTLGAPVMASTAGSLPEIAGDAGLLVDPLAVGDMAEAIRRLDQDLPLRKALSARGRAQAALFSPAAYERRLAEIYARLVRTGERGP